MTVRKTCCLTHAAAVALAVIAATVTSGVSATLVDDPNEARAEQKGGARPNPGAAAPAPAPIAAAPQAAPALPPIMPFEEAVRFAASQLFRSVRSVSAEPKIALTIDPLIDGNSGAQSTATRTIESRVSDLVRAEFPQYDLRPFNSATLARGPLLFIGTFTAVDKDGGNLGERDWYRICLALLDLRTGKIVAKGFARAHPGGIDHTPTAFFQDSPAWAADSATDGYVKTCQGTKPGDPINAAYWDKIVAAAMVNDAIEAYQAGKYEEALDLYRGVLRTEGGDQLRVHNGIYLAAWRLGRKTEAADAFGRLVDFGLAQERLSVKFLFRPGSTLFWANPEISGPYAVWLKQIAQRGRERAACLEISGHSSRTGAEPLNERLSFQRALYVKHRLDAEAPQLKGRTSAQGRGSRENVIGLGTDDARDALDRRVEFKVTGC